MNNDEERVFLTAGDYTSFWRADRKVYSVGKKGEAKALPVPVSQQGFIAFLGSMAFLFVFTSMIGLMSLKSVAVIVLISIILSFIFTRPIIAGRSFGSNIKAQIRYLFGPKRSYNMKKRNKVDRVIQSNPEIFFGTN